MAADNEINHSSDLTHAMDVQLSALALNAVIASGDVDVELLLQLAEGLTDPLKRELLITVSGCVNREKLETIAEFTRSTVPGALDANHKGCDCDRRDVCQVFTDR